MRLLLLFCLCLFSAGAFAQTSVSGRVLDAKTGDGLPGVTVLQTGTTNGFSSDAEGGFKLPVAGQPDSVALTISSIGYKPMQRVVAPGGNLRFQLVVSNKVTSCDLVMYEYPRFRVELSSCLRYTPMGGSVTFSHPQVLRSQLSVTAGYRTNYAHNYTWGASLGLPSIQQYRRFSFAESISYAKSHVPTANISFESAGVQLAAHFVDSRWPAISGGFGFCRVRTFQPEGAASSTGINYALGLGHRLPLGFYATAQAKRWPNAWQWEGSLRRDLPDRFYASLSLSYLPSYQEVFASLSRTFR